MMEMSTTYIINNLDRLFDFYHNAIQRSLVLVQRHPAMASIFRDSASFSTVYGQL